MRDIGSPTPTACQASKTGKRHDHTGDRLKDAWHRGGVENPD